MQRSWQGNGASGSRGVEVNNVTKILIVEDEPNMVAGLRDNFEYEGYQVITAGDGVEGLERALADSPDLVVLDVMMPRMSGLDVCKQLKARRPSIPVIMLTTLPREQERVSFGDVEVDLRTYQVQRRGKPVEFSAKEFELLKYFLCHPGEALSRDRLLDEVWGYEHYPTTRTVDAHIVHLRQKLEANPEEPRFILTIHGVGYKFVG